MADELILEWRYGIPGVKRPDASNLILSCTMTNGRSYALARGTADVAGVCMDATAPVLAELAEEDFVWPMS